MALMVDLPARPQVVLDGPLFSYYSPVLDVWWFQEACGLSVAAFEAFKIPQVDHYPQDPLHAIYGNIYHQYTPNVSIYTIHGSYGLVTQGLKKSLES